jgi:hypothetical protein
MMHMEIATDQLGLGLACRNADALSECKRNRCRVSLNRKVPNEALLLTRQGRLSHLSAATHVKTNAN